RATASPGNAHRPVAEEAARDVLRNLNPLDLREKEFLRFPSNEPDLQEHALVGYGELRGSILDPGVNEREHREEEQERHAQQDDDWEKQGSYKARAKKKRP